jgi:hypothetical protein
MSLPVREREEIQAVLHMAEADDFHERRELMGEITPRPNPKLEEAYIGMRQIGRGIWNLYQGLLDAGFDDVQAMKLTNTYVFGISRGNATSGPESDNPEMG